MSSPGLSIMRKIDRQDNIVHLHRQIHTYTLNIRTQMYTGNYREVYQSAGISPCLNACEQAIPSLPARLYREGTGITPPYFHCISSFFSLMSVSPLPVSFVLSLSCFSFSVFVCESQDCALWCQTLPTCWAFLKLENTL